MKAITKKNTETKSMFRRIKAKINGRIERTRSWEGDDPARKRKTYWKAYAASFCVLALAALFVYPSNGRSLVWSVDGLEQYYPFFIYEGQWIREIVQNLISGQGLQIPLWTHALGYGMDIPSTLDVFFDPLNLLSALCPERYSEYLFQFLVVFRLFLAGATFSLFAFRFKTGRFATLLAALLYALGGTAMAVAFWPASAWPLVLFPLLLLGAEKVLARERPYLFIVSVAAFFIISYYFSYMACLFLIPYCAARVLLTQGRMGILRFLGWTARFLGYAAIGILIACFALVPSIIGLLGIERVTDVAVTVPLLYPFSYYGSAFAGFLSFTGVGSDCYIGFGGIAVLACVLLFVRRGENKLLKLGFLGMTAMLLLPAAGSLMNGLNYATNRWVWAYALIVCFIVAKMLPSLGSLSKREVKAAGIAVVVYGLLVFLIPQARSEKTFAAFVILMAVLLLVAQRGLTERARRAGLAFCLAAGVVCNTFYLVSPDEGGVGFNSSPLGSLYTKLTAEAPNHLVADLNDPTLWRYDGDSTATVRTRNDSLVLGLYGIDFYNSSYNSHIDDYHTELGVAKTNINFSYKNLGGRAFLETLAGVKYYLMPDQAGVRPAYNYDDPSKVVASGLVRNAPYTVYEGTDILPLAFVYDSYVPRSLYDAMTPAQRQESLMQGVVLENSNLPETGLDLKSETRPYTITSTSGLTVEEGVIRVAEKGASMQLSFEGLPDCETYVYFDGLNHESLPPLESTPKKDFDAMSWYQKAYLLKQNLEWSAPTDYRITLTADKGSGVRTIENSDNDWHMYGGKDEWLVNMGYSSESQATVNIRFDVKGEYHFDEMSVVCQPMEAFSAQTQALKADPVHDLAFDTNKITANVNLDAPKAVFFSVPYSEGWTAVVDGEEVPLKRANTAFMALELEAGSHDIELRYMTPGLLEGMVLSSVGLCAFAAVAVFYAGRKHRGKAIEAKPARPSIEEGSSRDA
ncbi:YfhO family protein [Gordonibacter sp.]|uniref:YfhO family protein n=1 Tax=Gordonibacter sp. TaxID=1968902 RepID=UPI002FCB20BF